MGLLQNLRQLDRGVVAQVNPFDHGQTFASIVHPPQPVPAPVASPAAIKAVPTLNVGGGYNNVPHGSTVGNFNGGPAYYNPAGQGRGGIPVMYGNPSSEGHYYAVPYNVNSLPQPLPNLKPIPGYGGY